MEARKKGQDKQHNKGTKNNQTQGKDDEKMQAGNQTQGKDDEKMQAGNQTQASDPNTISNTHKEKQEQDKGKNSHMQVQ